MFIALDRDSSSKSDLNIADYHFNDNGLYVIFLRVHELKLGGERFLCKLTLRNSSYLEKPEEARIFY